MDFDALRDGLGGAIPFNAHLGLEIVELASGAGVVRLPDDARLRNHVGSQHAGGLFAAGEAASGGAFVAAFAERMAEITPLVEGACIAYRKLARGPITATGRLAADRDELGDELDRAAAVRFAIDVELTDADGDVVAEMTVRWHVRRHETAQ
jgi:acyl-coenzyme A thioesterase PaaI-like protein